MSQKKNESECESEGEEKRSGNDLGFLTPTLTPALFSAPQAAESCNQLNTFIEMQSDSQSIVSHEIRPKKSIKVWVWVLRKKEWECSLSLSLSLFFQLPS